MNLFLGDQSTLSSRTPVISGPTSRYSLISKVSIPATISLPGSDHSCTMSLASRRSPNSNSRARRTRVLERRAQDAEEPLCSTASTSSVRSTLSLNTIALSVPGIGPLKLTRKSCRFISVVALKPARVPP